MDPADSLKKRKEHHVKPVVTSSVKKQKPSLLKRVNESIVDDDAKSIPEFLVFDVIIPNVKSLIYDLVSIGFSRALFGEDSQRTRIYSPNGYTRQYSGKQYTSYSTIGNDARYKVYTPEKRTPVKHKYRNPSMVFEQRLDAENVLNDLQTCLIDYGEVSFATYYELIDLEEEINELDWNYGWTDLGPAWVHSCPQGGYLLELPPATRLD